MHYPLTDDEENAHETLPYLQNDQARARVQAFASMQPVESVLMVIPGNKLYLGLRCLAIREHHDVVI
jgi:hypothetical protein